MKRADKYPALDPRLPDLYRRIIDAADKMRTARHAESEVGWLMARVRLSAKAEAAASLADAEPVSKNVESESLPTLAKEPEAAQSS